MPEEFGRYERIYNYIKDNEGTKTEVVEYMKGRSAVVTTHKIIKQLIKEGKIISQPDKSNSQIHHLFINDRNSYNRINKELSDIEGVINAMNEHLRKITQIKDLDLQEKEKIGLAQLRMSFHYPYRDSVAAMLEVLLERTSILIKSKNDCQAIYTRIISLMLKLTLQFFNLKDIREMLANDINSLQKAKSSKFISDFAENRSLNIRVIDDLKLIMINFHKFFLNEKPI